jgi:hypothetical protein
MIPSCDRCGKILVDSPAILVDGATYCYSHAKEAEREILEHREYEATREHELYIYLRECCRRRSEKREEEKKYFIKKYKASSIKRLFTSSAELSDMFDRIDPPIQFPKEPPDDIDEKIDIEIHDYCLEHTSIIGYSRSEIITRDHSKCQACQRVFSSSELEIHHVIPQVKGGNDSPRNLITLCKKCHMEEEWFGHVHPRSFRSICYREYQMSKTCEVMDRRRRIKRGITRP